MTTGHVPDRPPERYGSGPSTGPVAVVLRGLGLGAVAGVLTGGLVGSAVFPVIGTLYGMYLGAGAGLVLGLVEGLVLAAATRRERPARELRLLAYVVAAVLLVGAAVPTYGLVGSGAPPPDVVTASLWSFLGAVVLALPAPVVAPAAARGARRHARDLRWGAAVVGGGVVGVNLAVVLALSVDTVAWESGWQAAAAVAGALAGGGLVLGLLRRGARVRRVLPSVGADA